MASASIEPLSRRAILKSGSLFIAGVGGAFWPGCSQSHPADESRRRPVRVGLLTDLHFADKDTAGRRYYRHSLAKCADAVAYFNRARADVTIELGDLIDAADTPAQELAWLERIEGVYRGTHCPRHHVLGNHCVYTLTKDEFLHACGQPRSFSSFEVGGFHFVLLDACFRRDGVPYGRRNFEWTDSSIPPEQLEWLQADLAATRLPTIVAVHQRLDVANSYGVANQAAVRSILEASRRVLLVLQGHNHVNDLRELNGIPYCTLTAMVEGSSESNAYALMTLSPDGAIQIDGFGRQQSQTATRRASATRDSGSSIDRE